MEEKVKVLREEEVTEVYQMINEYFRDEDEDKHAIDVSEMHSVNVCVNAAAVSDALYKEIDGVESQLIPSPQGWRMFFRSKVVVSDVLAYLRERFSAGKVFAVMDEDHTEYIILK